jgi:hypothetical protein
MTNFARTGFPVEVGRPESRPKAAKAPKQPARGLREKFERLLMNLSLQ